jgi:hypothetical protein
MNNIRLFQVLVLSSTTFFVVWFFLPFWSGYLSDDQYRLAEYNGYGAVLPVHHALYYGTWFGLWLIAALGLYFFQNWARHLFLALSFLNLALAPFSGFAVQAPIDVLFSATVSILDGAILAMAYLLPLSANFKKLRPTRRSSRRRR